MQQVEAEKSVKNKAFSGAENNIQASVGDWRTVTSDGSIEEKDKIVC